MEERPDRTLMSLYEPCQRRVSFELLLELL
jgi:hypothetical protein